MNIETAHDGAKLDRNIPSKGKKAAIARQLLVWTMCSALAVTLSACSLFGGDSSAKETPNASRAVTEVEDGKNAQEEPPGSASATIGSSEPGETGADQQQDDGLTDVPVEPILGIAPTGPELTDKWGTYRQAQLVDDSHILDYDKDIVGNLKNYNDDDVVSAVKWSARFLVSEGFDSEIARSNRKRDRKSAWERMKSSFADGVQGNVYMEINKPSNKDHATFWFGLGNPRDWRGKSGIREVYHPGELTYRPEVLRVTKIYEDRGLLNVTFKYKIERTVTDADGKEYLEKRSGSPRYGMKKSDNGDWVIADGGFKYKLKIS